jgi:RHS repeat-associated protein
MLASVPVALPDPLYSTAVNTDLVISTAGAGLVNNDFDADGNSLTASVVANPANGSLVSFNSSGTFTYRPNNGFSGIDTFTYKVNDGGADSNVATVSIAVGGNFGVRTNLDESPAGAMLLTGALALSQPLTLGHELVYRSDTVNPHPIVVLETSLLSSSGVPDSIDARLTFNGVQESTVSYDTTGLSAGDPLRFVLQADASSVATGYYNWSIELKAWFGGNSVARTYTGSQAVVNRSASEYGKGWWMAGLDQLYASSAGALLVKGNGDTLWFASDGAGGYLNAAGDTSFSTLVKNGNNTFTLTSKYGQVWDFSTAGLLTSVKDANDNTVSYTYADADSDMASDELAEITDPFSRDSTLGYTGGQLTSFQDIASRSTTLAHTSGKLTSVTHPDPDAGGSLASPVTEYQYDATTALLTIAEDPLNYQTTYAYSGTSRRLTSINHPNSTGWSLTAPLTIGLSSGSGNSLVDPADAIGTYTDERSKTWSFRTDRFGNITWFKDPLNNVTTTERDANGLPIRLTEADPDGAGSATSPVTRFGYSSSGNLVRKYLPDGNDLEWTYNGLSRALTQTNELNNVWEFTYDTDGNLTAAEDPLGNTTSYTVNSRGQVTQFTTPDPDGAGSLTSTSTQFAYNSGTGTLSTITNPDSSTRTFAYNSADLQLTMTDELSHVWSTAYDHLNRVTSETKPDPDGAGAYTAAVTTYAYNANGWLTETIDALGNDTDYTYNSRGWVTEIERPDPDGAGSLARSESTYSYDNVGNVTQEGRTQYTGGGVIARVYDDAGRLTSVTGPISGVGARYTYDNLGRVTQETETIATSTDYAYVKYQYNSRGWVTRSIQADPTNAFLVDGPATDFTYDAAGRLLTVTDPRGYVSSYAYDQRGLTTSVTAADPDGASAGLVSPITTYAYDNVGRNTSITNPLGRITTLAYDSRDRLTTITQPDPDGGGGLSAPVTSYAYDSASRRTSVTDPLSRMTTYAYDDSNRLTSITRPDPDGAGGLTSPVTTYFYNKLDSVTSVADPLANVTSYTYDNLQRRIQVTQPDPDGGGGLSSPVTSYTYNSQGLLAKITDPLSHDTTFGYDDHGRRTTVTNHESKTTTTAYDNLNRVTSITTADPDGAGGQTASVASTTYDRWNQVTRITDPRNGQTNFTYDSVGNLLTLDDASGNTTTWTYDGLSRVTAETNELIKTRAYTYDAASNLVRTFDRNGRVTRYGRDNLGRLTQELWYDGSTPPTASSITTTQGGPTNEVQRVGHTGAAFGSFTLTYSGQTTAGITFNATAAQVLAALENLSNIGVGDVAVAKTQSGQTQEWQVTFQGALAASNVSQITINTGGLTPAPSAIQTTDTQGSAGNAEVQTVTLSGATGGTFRLTFGTEQTGDLAYNASAGTVETALDGLVGIDNVAVTGSAGGPYTITFGGTQATTNVSQISADVTNLTNGTLTRTLSYAYDAASQLTSTSDPSADYDYTYDNLGRLTAEVQDIAGLTQNIEFAHSWNANAMRTSLASEIGGTADFKNDYTYDNLSRMTQVIQQDVGGGNVVGDKRVDFTYNALGQFSSLTRYQSTGTSNLVASTTYTYDTLNRLTDLDHKQNSTNLALYDYTYDAMNRITSMTHSVDGASSFTYDNESQLTAADHTSPISDESYSYDATGSRTGGSYTTTTNNRTTADGTYTYQYDDEGNRTRRTKNSDSSYEEYAWDHRNRLTKVTFKNSGGTTLKTVEYFYDTNNRLIRRTYDADGPGGGTATDQFWAFDGQSINPSLEFQGTVTSDLTNRYLWGPNVDQILTSEDVTSLGSAGNSFWALSDHLGTSRDLADLDEGSGVTSVTNHRFYDSFGNLKSETNATVDLLFGFTGKLFDEVTGQQNFWQRWFDGAIGQWLSEDPIGFAAGLTNLRCYVSNSPANHTDPFGLWENPSSSTQQSVFEQVMEDQIRRYRAYYAGLAEGMMQRTISNITAPIEQQITRITSPTPVRDTAVFYLHSSFPIIPPPEVVNEAILDYQQYHQEQLAVMWLSTYQYLSNPEVFNRRNGQVVGFHTQDIAAAIIAGRVSSPRRIPTTQAAYATDLHLVGGFVREGSPAAHSSGTILCTPALPEFTIINGRWAPWSVAPYRMINRGTGMNAHHGVNGVWMRPNWPQYNHNRFPAVLMPIPNHTATFDVFNSFQDDMARMQGVSWHDVDWSVVPPGSAWRLAESQFEASSTPLTTREVYFKNLHLNSSN